MKKGEKRREQKIGESRSERKMEEGKEEERGGEQRREGVFSDNSKRTNSGCLNKSNSSQDKPVSSSW